MPEQEPTVTHAQEPTELVEEPVTTTEAPSTDTGSQDVPEPVETVGKEDTPPSDVDYRQKYDELINEVEQLKQFIRSRDEDFSEDAGAKDEDAEYKIPADVKEFLTEFASKPQETLKKVIDTSVKPYKQALQEIQQQQAIDYIQTQKDFTPKMYDELLYIVEGPDRNRFFTFGNQNMRLRDLPPRQKAEAALQIYRSKKTQQLPQPQPTRPKPVTTTKSKPTGKDNAKSDDLLSSEEFARKYGIKSSSF